MNSSAVAFPNQTSTHVVPRSIVHRTRGQSHGAITRLVSPSELGEQIKPFVFLDRMDADGPNLPRFGFHPHSGIATLTLLLEGSTAYEDSTGAVGTMNPGAVEWMQAGDGVWHTGNAIGGRLFGYQLWVALPPELENSPPLSRYFNKDEIASIGPARVILGELDGVASPIAALSSMNYLDVRLAAGEVWGYQPPDGHDIAWVAVHKGLALVPDSISAGELAVFAESESPITFRAQGETHFVLGSAQKHPHRLVLGDYSVHTSEAALRRGEAGMVRIGRMLREAGKR